MEQYMNYRNDLMQFAKHQAQYHEMHQDAHCILVHPRVVIDQSNSETGTNTCLTAILHELMFTEDSCVCLMAQNENMRQQLVRELLRMMHNIDSFKPAITSKSKSRVEFDNGNVLFLAASENSMRGRTFTACYLHHAHDIPRVTEIMYSVIASMLYSKRAKVMITCDFNSIDPQLLSYSNFMYLTST